MSSVIRSFFPSDWRGAKALFAKLTVLVLLAIVLSSCASTRINDWPLNIPPRQNFIAVYEADSMNKAAQTEETYLSWILVFYQGSLLYPTGWQDIESFVLSGGDLQKEAVLQLQLAGLGESIGAEWSKGNLVRLIDNRMLSLWGSILQLAGTFDDQSAAIELIGGDVDALLSRKFNGDTIQTARYEDLLGLELFDDF